MTTINAIGSGLSGVTGSGNFVGANAPTITTPVLVGISDGSAAGGGDIGEIISDVVVAGSAVSLVTATPKTIATITLSAGDWDVWAELWTKPDGTTTVQSYIASISLTDNVPGAASSLSESTSRAYGLSVPAGVAISTPVAAACINVAGATPVYLVAQVAFSISTLEAYGKIVARRRH